jgi:hypothetical protein
MTEAQNIKAFKDSFEASRKRVYDALDKILVKLFGYVPDNPGELKVTRDVYTKAMHEVQEETGLKEGDPDFMLFVMEQLSRSPKFENEEVKKEK